MTPVHHLSQCPNVVSDLVFSCPRPSQCCTYPNAFALAQGVVLRKGHTCVHDCRIHLNMVAELGCAGMAQMGCEPMAVSMEKQLCEKLNENEIDECVVIDAMGITWRKYTYVDDEMWVPVTAGVAVAGGTRSDERSMERPQSQHVYEVSMCQLCCNAKCSLMETSMYQWKCTSKFLQTRVFRNSLTFLKCSSLTRLLTLP